MSTTVHRHLMHQRRKMSVSIKKATISLCMASSSVSELGSRINRSRGFRSTAILAQSSTAPTQSPSKGVAAGGTGGEGSDEGGGSQGARIAGIMFFSSLVGATACLGAWQAMRYTWKVELIETNKAKMASDPVNLPDGSEGAALAAAMSFIDKEADGKGVKGSGSEEGRELLDRLEGRRVRITGVFDHSREVLVGPRSAPAGMMAPTGPSSMATNPLGDFVYTPLRRGDGSTVLVNRGWAPRSKGKRWSRPEGEVTLVGVLKQAEKRNTFSPVNRPETRQLLWAEKAAMLEAAGCAGGEGSVIFVEAVGEDGDDRRATPLAKLPMHFGEFHVTPQTHLMYSATWFSLAAAGCVLTWTRFRRAGPVAIPAIKTPPTGGAGK